DPNLHFRNWDGTQKTKFPGLDVRTAGGYVIMPGSPGWEIIKGNFKSLQHWPEDIIKILNDNFTKKQLHTRHIIQRANLSKNQLRVLRKKGEAWFAGRLTELSTMGEDTGRNGHYNDTCFIMGSLVRVGVFTDQEIVDGVFANLCMDGLEERNIL